MDIGGCRHRYVVCALNGNDGVSPMFDFALLVVFAFVVLFVVSLAAAATWCLVVLPIRDWWTARRRHALVVRRVS